MTIAIQRGVRQLGVALAGVILAAHFAGASRGDDKPKTPVEHETAKPGRDDDFIQSTPYKPSPQERPHYARLADDEQRIPGENPEYRLGDRNGKFVGWFGVVRDVAEKPESNSTTLLVEHKYFDGTNSTGPRMTVSFNGAGEFLATLQGVGHRIEMLTLVKAYGVVSRPDADGALQLAAVFVRNWHWGSFAFRSAYGIQHGSEKWRRFNQLRMDFINNPFPEDHYYESVLGKRIVVDEFRRQLLAAAGKVGSETEPVVSELIEALRRGDHCAQYQALQILEARQHTSNEIALLEQALAIGDETARSTALVGRALLRQYPAAWSGKALEDKSARVRVAGVVSVALAFGLGNLEETAVAPSVAALQRALDDPEPNVRFVAAQALGAIGPPAGAAAPDLTRRLQDDNPDVRIAAAEALWRTSRQTKPAVDALIAALKHDDPKIRGEAAKTLAKMESDAASATNALTVALGDASPESATAAAAALRQIGPAARSAVPALVSAVRSPEHSLRWEATEALGKIGGTPETVVPALIRAVRDRAAILGPPAMKSLGAYGADAAPAVAALLEQLHNEAFYDARFYAAQALADIGPKAKAAAPDLKAALADESVVRAAAARALWRIEGDSRLVMPVVLELFAADDKTFSKSKVETEPQGLQLPSVQGLLDYETGAPDAVRAIGPAAAGAVSALIRTLQYRSADYRVSSALALGSIGPAAESAIPELAARLEDDLLVVRVSAAESLWKIKRDPRAIPALVKALNDGDWRMRPPDANRLCYAMQGELSQPGHLIPEIINMLKGSAWKAHRAAAQALGEIGPEAKAAVPSLVRALGHADLGVRVAAANALRRVDPQAAANAGVK